MYRRWAASERRVEEMEQKIAEHANTHPKMYSFRTEVAAKNPKRKPSVGNIIVS